MKIKNLDSGGDTTPEAIGVSFFMCSVDQNDLQVLTYGCNGNIIVNIPYDTDTVIIGLIYKLQQFHDIFCVDDISNKVLYSPAFKNDDFYSVCISIENADKIGTFDYLYKENKIRANRRADDNKMPIPYPEYPFRYDWEYPTKKEKIKSTDHLYVIQNTVSSAYKIGRSKNPKKRLSTLNIASTDPLILISSYKEMGFMEKEIHSMFTSKRSNTEWFFLDEKDIQNIENFINDTI